MKTTREWYNQLPPQIRKLAIENTSKEQLKDKHDCLSSALWSGFTWNLTKQGMDFWESVTTITEYFENN